MAPAPLFPLSGDRAARTDLVKSITLSEKFWFQSELFAGDKQQYDAAIDALAAASDKAAAEQLLGRYAPTGDVPGRSAYAALRDVVLRRYT